MQIVCQATRGTYMAMNRLHKEVAWNLCSSEMALSASRNISIQAYLVSKCYIT